MDRFDAMQAFARVVETGSFTKAAATPVSYTHLDVYKRQGLLCRLAARNGDADHARAGA